jgi:hypothetical protein
MYATNPGKLKALTEKLRAGRLTCPLFDTKRWVSCGLRSFVRMYQARRCSFFHDRKHAVGLLKGADGWNGTFNCWK